MDYFKLHKRALTMVWFKDIQYLVDRYHFRYRFTRSTKICPNFFVLSHHIFNQQVERLSFKGIDFSRELDQTCCIAQFHFLIAFHCKILLDNPPMISINTNTVFIFYP